MSTTDKVMGTNDMQIYILLLECLYIQTCYIPHPDSQYIKTAPDSQYIKTAQTVSTGRQLIQQDRKLDLLLLGVRSEDGDSSLAVEEPKMITAAYQIIMRIVHGVGIMIEDGEVASSDDDN